MHARLWHRECLTPPVLEPAALLPGAIPTMSREDRASYADSVRRWLRSKSIVTPDLHHLADLLTDTEEANRQSPPGAKKILVVSGPNGAGKSTAIRKWANNRYRGWIREHTDRDLEGVPFWRPAEFTECDILPVCWVNLHSAARIKDLNSQILSFLGLPPDGVTRAQTGRVSRSFDRHKIRLLVIDDVHLLKTSEKIGREVLDHLKHLNTELGELGGTVLLVGANLDGSELLTDPQIAARLDLHHLDPYPVSTATERRRWQLLLKSMEIELAPYLPNSQPGMLHDQFAGELWKRTQGYLGDLSTILAEATYAAIVDGTFSLTKSHLAVARLSSRAHTEQVLLER